MTISGFGLYLAARCRDVIPPIIGLKTCAFWISARFYERMNDLNTPILGSRRV